MAKKLTSAKASKILHDKKVHGKPLTDKQRKFFGAVASGLVPYAENGIEGTMGGLTDVGFDYNGAWGGTMQMGGSLPGSVGFMYARTQSPAPSNGPYAKKTKASAQDGSDVTSTYVGDNNNGGGGNEYIEIPGGFNKTVTRGVSETFDPSNPRWRGNDQEWLQKRIKNAELLVQAIKDAKSLPKKEWEQKYKGASFAAVGEGRSQPILPEFYNDYKKKDDAFIKDWSMAKDQAKNELLMQSKWTQSKEKAKKEALDFLSQYKGQNEFISNLPTEAAKKYGYTPGELENVSPWQFLSKDAVSKAYYAINANKGFPLPQDPTNEMTCANGVCTIESMVGVDFSPLKGKKGVYYDPETGYTIPQYNPTWLENENYKKVGYRKLDNLNELPQPGDIVQYSDEKGVPGHMELVLENLPNGIIVYNNYSQTNDYRPGEGKEVRGYKPGTYQQLATDNFAQTNYFRLTPEAQQKALSRNPTYLKKVEGKKAFESSEDYKKFMETQEYIKANQEKYNKLNEMNPQNWRNGGRTSAQNGQEMKFYQEGLDWKPKNISKNGGWLEKYQDGGIIEDPMGQWAHPGEITRIPSNEITMQGVDYPVMGISDTGDTQMMQPGQDYTFDGNSVTEIPMMQKGGKLKKFVTDVGTAMSTAINPAIGIANMVEPATDLLASTLLPYETVEQREDIFRRYRPIEYPNPINITRGLLYPDEQGKPGKDPQKDLNVGEEAWRKALDLPTKQKYIVPSKYKPSTAKDKNKQYYTLKDVIDPEKVIAEAKRQGWKPGIEYQMHSLKPLILDKDFSWSKDFADIDPLQSFKMSIDPKGEYVSIYDVYDFDFPGVNKMIKPYEFYDRFYLPETKSTKKKQNGGWLNKYE